MFVILGQALVGLAMLYVGGDFLVRGASALALRLGVSPLAIGLTVVAFGTSAPELVVSLDAALSGANDISVGNVVGSNIANLGLVLGLAVLLRPLAVNAEIVRVDAPIMLGASLALVAVLADGRVSGLDGGLLVLALVGLGAFTVWKGAREEEAVREELASAAPPPAEDLAKGALLALGGLAILVGGGHLLVVSAVALAASLGIGQAVIGLTIVAVGTSLPELATSVLASLRGQSDIAIGNVVGSNIFNILGILGVTASVHPLERGGITGFDLGAMLALAIVVTLLVSVRLRLGRVDGALLLAAFVLYTARLLAG